MYKLWKIFDPRRTSGRDFRLSGRPRPTHPPDPAQHRQLQLARYRLRHTGDFVSGRGAGAIASIAKGSGRGTAAVSRPRLGTVGRLPQRQPPTRGLNHGHAEF